MLFDPAAWLYDLMELTPMSGGFKLFILVLGIAGFAVGYLGEKITFPWLAKATGHLKKTLFKQEKKRKEYKIILERSSTEAS